MKNSQITKPTLTDYNRLEDFAHACAQLNSTLSILNNHIEVLKRSGDIDSLAHLNSDLTNFLFEVVTNYKSTLEHDKED